jgi:ATP-dependent RNA helicase DDX49/DBP8
MPAKPKKLVQMVDSNMDDKEFSSDSGSDAESGSDIEPKAASGSNSDSDSDSDSLDQHGPRKRRRTLPETVADSDPKTRFISTVSVPSRIRRVEKQTPTQTTAMTPPPGPTPGITAPIHADVAFESLGVNPWLVQSLANLAIKRPTGIQKATIPELLKGRDCIGGSRTGSGKTVAFAVPMLQRWAENPTAIYGVVLTPTR